jgi:integrase
MSITYKAVLRPPLKTGNRPVHIRITSQRKHFYLVSSVDLPEALWNEKADPIRANWVRSTHPSAKQFNSRIQSLLNDVRELVLDGTPRTAEQVKQLVANKNGIGRSAVSIVIPDTQPTDFLTYFAEEVKRRSVGGHPRSVEKLASILQKVRSYLAPPRELEQPDEMRGAQLVAQRLPFAALTPRWVRDYITHLESLGNKDSTIQKELSFLKTMVRRAIEDDLLAESKNPFKHLRLHEPPPVPKAKLTLEQVAQMEALELPPPTKGRKSYTSLQLAREVWLLQYYLLGTRVGDVLTLRWRAVGAEVVTFFEQKTNKQKVAPRHEKLNAVLIRLAALCEHQPPRPQDFVVPSLSADAPYAQYPPTIDWRMFARLPAHRTTWHLLLKRIEASTTTINSALKELATYLSLENKTLTSHTARHSFANAGRISGIPASHMRDMLNHHSVAQTEAYFGELKQDEVSEWALQIYK